MTAQTHNMSICEHWGLYNAGKPGGWEGGPAPTLELYSLHLNDIYRPHNTVTCSGEGGGGGNFRLGNISAPPNFGNSACQISSH